MSMDNHSDRWQAEARMIHLLTEHGSRAGMDTARDAKADATYLFEVLGRKPRGWWSVASRDEQGQPLVLATYPLWFHKEVWYPFPNTLWLVNRQLIADISELERVGHIAMLEEELAQDPKLAEQMQADHARYAKLRWAMLDEAHRQVADSWQFEEALRTRGVGGLKAGGQKIKCFHAHVAHHLAFGLPNAIGQRVMELLG